MSLSVKRFVFMAAFSVIVALQASGQMTIGPWTASAVGPGCVPPLSCTTCTTAFTAGIGGGTITASLQSMSATPSNINPSSTCSTGIRLTSTMTIGPGGGGSRVIVSSDLTGALNTLSAFGSTGCAASVQINAGAVLDLQHPSVVNPAGLVSVSDHREDTCLLLAPGAYTVDIVLATSSATPLTLPPVVVDTSDFMSPGNGLVVSFSDDGANSLQATTISFNGCPPNLNPDILTADPAIIGKPWTASVTLGFNRAAAFWALFFGFSSVSPPCGILIPQSAGNLNFGNAPPGRILLCALDASGRSLTAPHTGVLGTVSTANSAVPCNVSLIGIDWCGQALVFGVIPALSGGGSVRLSSGIAGVIGTF